MLERTLGLRESEECVDVAGIFRRSSNFFGKIVGNFVSSGKSALLNLESKMMISFSSFHFGLSGMSFELFEMGLPFANA